MYLSSTYVCTDVGFFGCFKTSREFLVSRTWERKFYLLFSPNTISSNTSPHPFFIIEDLEAEEKIFQRTKIMLQNGFGLLTQENDGCPVYPLFSYLNFICRVIFFVLIFALIFGKRTLKMWIKHIAKRWFWAEFTQCNSSRIFSSVAILPK